MSSADTLPEAALTCILQHLSLQDRFKAFALVCRSWAAAVWATQTDVDTSFCAGCQSLQTWLLHHPGALQRLKLVHTPCNHHYRHGGVTPPTLHLPTQGLSQLRSCSIQARVPSCMRLDLEPSDTASTHSTRSSSSRSSANAGGLTTVLPVLQELCLANVHLTSQLWTQLLGTHSLSQLEWRDCVVYADNTWTHPVPPACLPYSGLFSQVAQQLPRLTNLSVASARHTAGYNQPSGMQAQELAHSIWQLSSLQQLTSLHLAVDLYWPGPPHLLWALEQLSSLRHLTLHCSPLHHVSVKTAAYAALTASTNLTALELREPGGLFPLVHAAVDAMFAPERVLPNLKTLKLLGSMYWPDSDEEDEWGFGSVSRADAHDDCYCVGPQQVSRIAACCTALERLTLRGVVCYGFDYRCLAQLPAAVTFVEGLGLVRR